MSDVVIVDGGNVVVVPGNNSPAQVITPQSNVVVTPGSDDQEIIVVHDAEPAEIDVENAEVSVHDGYGGGDGSMRFLSSQAMPIGMVVKASDNYVYPYNVDGLELYGVAIGLTVTATVTDNQPIRVRDRGLLKKTGWGLTPGAIYYAAVDGSITSDVTIDPGLVILPVGVALDAETLKIQFGTSYTKRT